MKRIKSLILTAICVVLAAGSASAFTSAERAAQLAVNNYLKKQGYSTKIDDKDQSVNFQYKSNLFWVTFEESNNGVLYTLHRRPLKLDDENKDDKEKLARQIEIAMIAADWVNSKYAYKTFVTGSRINFEFPTFASTPDDYIKVFPSVLKALAPAKDNFDAQWKKAKERSDSIHNYWASNDPNTIVVPQLNPQVKQASNNLIVTGVDFKVVDEGGRDISGYGQSIRKSDIRYIQPQITIQAPKKGMYNIGMLIVDPEGKKLLPEAKANRTSVTTVEIDKKPTTVELNSFGSKSGSFWKAGEYTVTFYDGDQEIKRTTFTIL